MPPREGRRAGPGPPATPSWTLRASGPPTPLTSAASTGGKKVKGRKRHICTDTLGNLPRVSVHAANIHDTTAGPAVFRATLDKHPSIEAFSADEGYRGTSEGFVSETLKRRLDIARGVKGQWAVLKKRWIVERTFAWLQGARRLSKDFEITTRSGENMVRLAMIRIMLARADLYPYSLLEAVWIKCLRLESTKSLVAQGGAHGYATPRLYSDSPPTSTAPAAAFITSPGFPRRGRLGCAPGSAWPLSVRSAATPASLRSMSV